jgi:8-oxo-dGTP pyrophosphatase MutT (NUDIX family)
MGSYSSEFVRDAKASDALSFRKIGQCGAICWRIGKDGNIEVLLISSGDTDYWAIPKGDIRKHELLYRCAQRQAMEKAGVAGRISKTPLGHYTYRKSSPWNPLTVLVHLLFVESESRSFQPEDRRQCFWLSANDAAAHISEPELQQLIIRLVVDADAPKFVATIRKTLSGPKTNPRPSGSL